MIKTKAANCPKCDNESWMLARPENITYAICNDCYYRKEVYKLEFETLNTNIRAFDIKA